MNQKKARRNHVDPGIMLLVKILENSLFNIENKVFNLILLVEAIRKGVVGIIIKIIKVETQFNEVPPKDEGSKALNKFVIIDKKSLLR